VGRIQSRWQRGTNTKLKQGLADPVSGVCRVRTAGGPLRSKIVAVEKVRLRIGNLANAVLVSGQVYRDPKDALNEFMPHLSSRTTSEEPRPHNRSAASHPHESTSATSRPARKARTSVGIRCVDARRGADEA
jgi:hypothetical protein